MKAKIIIEVGDDSTEIEMTGSTFDLVKGASMALWSALSSHERASGRPCKNVGGDNEALYPRAGRRVVQITSNRGPSQALGIVALILSIIALAKRFI